MFKNFLFPRFLRFYMADESPAVEINVKTQEENAPKTEQENVTDQAATIVETAENLAQKMARSSDDTDAILAALSQMFETLVQMREANAAAHAEILSRIDSVEYRTEQIEEEIQEVEGEVKEEVQEPEPVEAPQEPEQVPQEEPTPPQKRSRRWL